MPQFVKRSAFTFCITFLILLSILRNRFYESSSPVPRIVVNRPSLCRTASVFRCDHCIPEPFLLPDKEKVKTENKDDNNWKFESDRDARNLRLTDAQCDVAFPGLFEDIKIFVEKRKTKLITKDEILFGTSTRATIHLMIYNNELYVIRHKDPEFHAVRSSATIHAIYRAILTSPSPLPNTEFAISVEDFVDDLRRVVWSYARTADDENTWLMPDFGFWSYGESYTPAALGSWDQVRLRAHDIEQDYESFDSKIPKLFWRGDISLAEDLRTRLLEKTHQKPWADVRSLNIRWDDKTEISNSALPIHDHCRYMFLIHTEGNSYSGRLKYLQNCRSVIFAHTLEWIQPFEYLMVPSGPKQNYVEISRDFSDLAAKVKYYLKHLDEAERIANNSISTFRDRYNTPAAETCYWRKLIRGWREVGFEPEFYMKDESHTKFRDAKVEKRWRGTPFANYAITHRVDSVDPGSNVFSNN